MAEEVAAIQEGWDRLGHRRGRRDDQWYPGVFFVKTDAEILDGLLGTIWAKRMYVSIRGTGTLSQQRLRYWGTGTAERRGAIRRRGWIYRLWLSTFSFQARPFYERLGYGLFGTLESYPDSHSLFFMAKPLVHRRICATGDPA